MKHQTMRRLPGKGERIATKVNCAAPARTQKCRKKVPYCTSERIAFDAPSLPEPSRHLPGDGGAGQKAKSESSRNRICCWWYIFDTGCRVDVAVPLLAIPDLYTCFRDLISTTQPYSQSLLRSTVHRRLEPSL